MKKYTLLFQRNLENTPYKSPGFYSQVFLSLTVMFFLVLTGVSSSGQNPMKTFTAGTYIIDMGQATQTIANGLKPYGLVYQMIVVQGVPVYWAINSSKVKDGVDFSADGKSYSGGSFILSSERITAPIVTLINEWKAKGVVVDGPVLAGFTAPVYKLLTCWPVAVLDNDNDGIIAPYYANAEIPKSSYKLNANPTMLAGCTGGDLYVLPHADPDGWDATWITALQTYISNGGYLWAGCHAVSVLENLPGCNFLSNGGLVPYGDHSNSNPNPPFTYMSSSDASPIMQCIGGMDDATTNGSENIYVPGVAGWRVTTTVAVYDADYINTKTHIAYTYPDAAAVLVYGHAFGNGDMGMVMYEAGHDLSGGTTAEKVAAQRVYFNFVLMAGVQKQITISITTPDSIEPLETYQVSATASGGTAAYTYLWSSEGGGTFSSTTGNPTNYTAPSSAANIIIKCEVTDACGRVNFVSEIKENPYALPIELLDYNAVCLNGTAVVTWTTLSETNNDFFSVEKSVNFADIALVGTSAGAGNSNVVLNYSLTDDDPDVGIIYYRIRQTDYDGKTDVTEWMTVNIEKTFDFNIYPNPFSTSLSVIIKEEPKGSSVELWMYNETGEMVINTIVNNQATVLETNNFPSGKYFYRVVVDDKTVKTGKLISQQ